MVDRIYQAAFDSAIDTETSLKLMGFQGQSGPSTAALSSIKQYGLIEGRDQAIKVTPLAVRILHPSNDEEKSSGLREAASNPRFYADIEKQFGGRIPGDQVLKSQLVRSHGFNPNGADDFIRVLKENRAFMEMPERIEDGHTTEREDSTPQPALSSSRPLHNSVRMTSPQLGSIGEESLRFRVSPECVVSIFFSGPVSRHAIEKSIQYLELAKENYSDPPDD
ncbi:hypothetical protein [Bradyrhizobium sp. S69]|uniref:hypothetical protein n=1 Tax=Bradyrhizobium sp. S69 TaxID=1641856 RepID=UPI00131D77C8|nr:hypothetical protein [Bradyrhizobium sp. S69]